MDEWLNIAELDDELRRYIEVCDQEMSCYIDVCDVETSR